MWLRLDFDLDDGRTWKEAFGKSSLNRCNQMVFFFTRAFLTSSWFFVIVWDLVDNASRGELKYWCIYATHWGMVLELLWLLFGTYTTGQALWGSVPDGTGQATPWFVSMTWFSCSMAAPVGLLTTVIWWHHVLMDYDATFWIDTLNVLKHGGNSAIALMDLLFGRQPLYFVHMYAPLFISVTYIAFTYIYYQAGGENHNGDPFIYSSFDWRNQDETTTQAALFMFVLMPITYCLFYSLVRVRTRCQTASEKAQVDEVPNEGSAAMPAADI